MVKRGEIFHIIVLFRGGNVMTEVYQAILFDTRSIQRYIYTGNRLKTNIGASYLVKHVFSDILVPVLV